MGVHVGLNDSTHQSGNLGCSFSGEACLVGGVSVQSVLSLQFVDGGRVGGGRTYEVQAPRPEVANGSPSMPLM